MLKILRAIGNLLGRVFSPPLPGGYLTYEKSKNGSRIYVSHNGTTSREYTIEEVLEAFKK